MSESIEPIVAQELDGLGFELVELRRGGSRARPVLEIRIDRRDGEKVTIDDCARASRALEARLEADALVAEQYVLEVSSPGADRPLRTAADWRRFVGRRALCARAYATVEPSGKTVCTACGSAPGGSSRAALSLVGTG